LRDSVRPPNISFHGGQLGQQLCFELSLFPLSILSLSPPSPSPHRQKCRSDFEIVELIAQGTLGKVHKVIDKEDATKYAMKIISQSYILDSNNLANVEIERSVMSKCHHINIIRLILTFLECDNLYYVTELASHGNLQQILIDRKTLNIEATQVIVGQTLLAISHLHQKRILHRNLHPENLLIGNKWNIKVNDFKTAKILDESGRFELQRGDFVGSADYVSPEVLENASIGLSADLWAIGCILYTLLAGVAPFHCETQSETFQRIQALNYTFPSGFPDVAKDLVSKLLVREPTERLGNGEYENEYESIRKHPFFTGIDWKTLPEREVPTLRNPKPQVKLEKAVKETEEEVKGVKSEVPELLDGQRSILEGRIVKKRKMTKKNRWLVLTDKPRLFYVDLKNRKIKGEIPLTDDTKVAVGKKTKWNVKVPGRVYHLRSKGEIQPNQWAEAIKRILGKC
jgi:3-phosphoinositide dependent protein kinase-1